MTVNRPPNHSPNHAPVWKQNSQVFDERADEYDRWFDDSLLFKIELMAIQSLLPPNWQPALEIGVGPGRFAEAMGSTYGLDPAQAPLHLARQRGITACQGQAESLPFHRHSLQGIAILFTLCFLEHPEQALSECVRVLKPGGHLLIGFVPAQSAWGQELEKKKEAGHPFYKRARFHTIVNFSTSLQDAGLTVLHSCSTLFQKPGQLSALETPKLGLDERAGFVALLCQASSGS